MSSSHLPWKANESHEGITKFVGMYLSRIKRIRSLANKPRLDKHEKPNKARVKKNIPG